MMLILWIATAITTSACMSPDSHMVLIEYTVKSTPVERVDLMFEYEGRKYFVAEHRYTYPVANIVDTILWVLKSVWKCGNLELIFHGPNVKDIVKIKGDEIKVKYFDAKYDTTCYCNAGLRKMDDFPDPYAWRTVGYDPQHTGYYPLPIYPPMELKWTYNWGVLVAGQPR